MMNNEVDINNGNNFFICTKKENMVFFWGQNIQPQNILIDKKIKDKMAEYHISYEEVIEIYDDETHNFFLDVYMERNDKNTKPEIKRFIFISNEGYTYQPNSNADIPDIENSQVIGFSYGKDEEEAFNNLLKENKYIKETSFNQIISYHLSSDSDQSKKYFYLSEEK